MHANSVENLFQTVLDGSIQSFYWLISHVVIGVHFAGQLAIEEVTWSRSKSHQVMDSQFLGWFEAKMDRLFVRS